MAKDTERARGFFPAGDISPGEPDASVFERSVPAVDPMVDYIAGVDCFALRNFDAARGHFASVRLAKSNTAEWDVAEYGEQITHRHVFENRNAFAELARDLKEGNPIALRFATDFVQAHAYLLRPDVGPGRTKDLLKSPSRDSLGAMDQKAVQPSTQEIDLCREILNRLSGDLDTLARLRLEIQPEVLDALSGTKEHLTPRLENDARALVSSSADNTTPLSEVVASLGTLRDRAKKSLLEVRRSAFVPEDVESLVAQLARKVLEPEVGQNVHTILRELMSIGGGRFICHDCGEPAQLQFSQVGGGRDWKWRFQHTTGQKATHGVRDPESGKLKGGGIASFPDELRITKLDLD